MLVTNTAALDNPAAVVKVLDIVAQLLGIPTDAGDNINNPVNLAGDTASSLLREVLSNELSKALSSELSALRTYAY